MSTWFPRITAHSLIVVVSVLIYILTTRVQHSRRPPAVAIAWVLGLIALPYLVLPMYLFFGQRKLRRKIPRRRNKETLAAHWAEDLIQSFGLAAAAPAAIRMHQDGSESAQALYSTISSAVSRLDICTFILGNDAFGQEVMQLIIERARCGVEIRLLLDGFGSIQMPGSWFKRMRAAGVATAIFSPMFARHTQGPRNLRNHRKLVIADALRLWAGGRNLAAEYFTGAAGAPPWLDLTFDLQGAVAAAAACQFEEDWVAAGGKAASGTWPAVAALDAAASLPMPPGSSRAQFLPSGPDQTEDTVQALLIDACFHSRERILAVTPYFVPDASLEIALRLAARRGVQIDICLPAASNHRLADFARNRALRSLSQAGVNFHLLPYMNHAKAVVFDESLALSGSVNLDSRSLLLNYECAVVFYSSAEIDWLAGWMAALIPGARTFDCRAPGLLRDLTEGLLLTVAYQL